jgi:hypothetical protein
MGALQFYAWSLMTYSFIQFHVSPGAYTPSIAMWRRYSVRMERAYSSDLFVSGCKSHWRVPLQRMIDDRV